MAVIITANANNASLTITDGNGGVKDWYMTKISVFSQGDYVQLYDDELSYVRDLYSNFTVAGVQYASAVLVEQAIAALLIAPGGGTGGNGLPLTPVLSCADGTFPLAAASNYFFGTRIGIQPLLLSASAGGFFKYYIPKTCTIKTVSVSAGYIQSAGAAHTPASVYIVKNSSSATLIDGAIDFSSQAYNSNNTVSISCSAGDYIEGKLVTPDWGLGANPTGIFCSLYLYMD